MSSIRYAIHIYCHLPKLIFIYLILLTCVTYADQKHDVFISLGFDQRKNQVISVYVIISLRDNRKLDFFFLFLIIGFVLRWKTLISKFTVGTAHLRVLQAIKPANLFTQIKPAICNLALFLCIRTRTFNSTVVLGFELEAGWEGTLNRSAVWTQDNTPEWENVTWRVHEYETGLQSRQTKVFCVTNIISFNP